MPKQVDHGLRRRQLVEASWTVIARDGIEGATLRKVAAAANCTTGRIAHYFTGRDELIVSALRAAYTDAGKRMAAIIETEAKTEADARTRLSRVVYEGLPLDAARLREWKVWIAFWAAAASDVDLAQENARRYAEWQQLLSELIAKISGNQGVEGQALALVCMIDGLGIRATLVPSEKNRGLARAAIDAWIVGL